MPLCAVQHRLAQRGAAGVARGGTVWRGTTRRNAAWSSDGLRSTLVQLEGALKALSEGIKYTADIPTYQTPDVDVDVDIALDVDIDMYVNVDISGVGYV